MKYAFAITSNSFHDFAKLFNLLKLGLRPEDRNHIDSLFGVCKHPALSNGRGVMVNPNHQSSSANFNALKIIAMSLNTNTELHFVRTGEGLDANYASVVNGQVILTPTQKSKYFNGKPFSLTPRDFVGWTTYPVDNPPSETSYPVYSSNPITRANVLVGRADVEIVVTIYHELRAHVLQSKIGLSPSLGNHGLPSVEKK